MVHGCMLDSVCQWEDCGAYAVVRSAALFVPNHEASFAGDPGEDVSVAMPEPDDGQVSEKGRTLPLQSRPSSETR